MIEFVDKEVNEALNNELEAYEMATTSRLYKRLTDDKTCAIISPYREEYSEAKNKERMVQLKADVRNLGLGFNQFISRWVKDGVAYDEQSLLIPNISEEVAILLGSRYNQDSIIFKDSKSCREICITPFETYQPGDIVRIFYNTGNKILNIEEAKQIFSKRVAGPASMPIKGDKRPFTLKVADEVLEVNQPRPSYFQTSPSYTRFLWKK